MSHGVNGSCRRGLAVKQAWAWSVVVLTMAMGGAAILGGKSMLESAVVSHTVSESRTVADMADTVGRWASQYGGMHARTVGAGAPIPGSFLTRSVYAGEASDGALLQGSATGQRAAELEALSRVEVYHWKNPVLIQREVADVLLAGGNRAQYRLTARTVLNPNNAPTPFEIEALDAIQSQSKAEGGANKALEYWRVDGDRMLYARALIGQKSCMACHDTAEKAPEFLRSNQQFNGGGGFGYKVGEPVGLISVRLPMPAPQAVLTDTLPKQAWAWLLLASAAGVGLLVVGAWGGLSALRSGRAG